MKSTGLLPTRKISLRELRQVLEQRRVGRVVAARTVPGEREEVVGKGDEGGGLIADQFFGVKDDVPLEIHADALGGAVGPRRILVAVAGPARIPSVAAMVIAVAAGEDQPRHAGRFRKRAIGRRRGVPRDFL